MLALNLLVSMSIHPVERDCFDVEDLVRMHPERADILALVRAMQQLKHDGGAGHRCFR